MNGGRVGAWKVNLLYPYSVFHYKINPQNKCINLLPDPLSGAVRHWAYDSHALRRHRKLTKSVSFTMLPQMWAQTALLLPSSLSFGRKEQYIAKKKKRLWITGLPQVSEISCIALPISILNYLYMLFLYEDVHHMGQNIIFPPTFISADTRDQRPDTRDH